MSKRTYFNKNKRSSIKFSLSECMIKVLIFFEIIDFIKNTPTGVSWIFWNFCVLKTKLTESSFFWFKNKLVLLFGDFLILEIWLFDKLRHWQCKVPHIHLKFSSTKNTFAVLTFQLFISTKVFSLISICISLVLSISSFRNSFFTCLGLLNTLDTSFNLFEISGCLSVSVNFLFGL